VRARRAPPAPSGRDCLLELSAIHRGPTLDPEPSRLFVEDRSRLGSRSGGAKAKAGQDGSHRSAPRLALVWAGRAPGMTSRRNVLLRISSPDGPGMDPVGTAIVAWLGVCGGAGRGRRTLESRRSVSDGQERTRNRQARRGSYTLRLRLSLRPSLVRRREVDPASAAGRIVVAQHPESRAVPDLTCLKPSVSLQQAFVVE
jgi:hypothetical protein